MRRFAPHNHTYFSNLRGLDALSSPEQLIDRAVEIGLAGLAITEHGCVSSHVRANEYGQEVQKEHPDFKVALGEEQYLIKERGMGQRYWHHIMIAKDAIGAQMLREMSSIAWLNSYFDRGVQRVPILYSEVEDTIRKYGKGHLIASQACIGGRCAGRTLQMIRAEHVGDEPTIRECHDDIVEYMLWMDRWFGDDYYLEVAPAAYDEQIEVNRRMKSVSKAFGKKIVIGDDSHRTYKQDYAAHKAFLNSKFDDEREDIDSFYKYTYLQTDDEIEEHLKDTELDVPELYKNSMEVYDKVENYSLLKPQRVPQIAVPDIPKVKSNTKYEHLDTLRDSDSPQERYWLYHCERFLKDKGLYNDVYLSELDHEADVQLEVGHHLGTCIFSYPIFLSHYLDKIWDCGSIIGPGRGSDSAGLDNYAFGLTQTDPIKAGINNYFRYLNKTRYELPDADFDMAPTARPKWFQRIRDEEGETRVVQVCTFTTIGSRAAILSACRGYRSQDYPDGIDLDEAQYISSLIGSDRGFTYTISDMVDGNESKGLKPNQLFVSEVSKFPGLLDIIKKIEGVITARSIHASGILFFDKGHEYDSCALMKATDGSIITQYSLHDAEKMSNVKFDALLTDVCEKISQTLLMLQEHGKIDRSLSLRQMYDRYLHPDVLPIEDKKIWDTIDSGTIPSLFQFETVVGGQAIKKLKPTSIQQLAAINALIRLMAQEKGGESPQDRYYRIQQHPEQWIQEMDSAKVPKGDQKIIEEYCGHTFGTLPLQDDLMLMLMDERLFGFELAFVNKARKVISKKKMQEIPRLHKDILEHAKNPITGKYIWDALFSEQLGYAFNKEHTYSYSLIALQCAYLYIYFPSVYWNCACLRTDAGLENDDNSNYAKLARAVGNMINLGTSIKPIDINKSQYLFEPDEENNAILYGMKALNGVGGDIIQSIVSNRPYHSLSDFIDRTNANKTAVIALIKSGAFDAFGERKEVMKSYLMSVSNPKKRITLQNFKGLMEQNMIPSELDFQRRVFTFNKMLKANKKVGDWYCINYNYYDFYEQFFDINLLEPREGTTMIPAKTWDKAYKKAMEPAREYFKRHQTEILAKVNARLLQEQWDKYCGNGSYSAWEMDSMGYYYHPHELMHINKRMFQIVSYKELPREPEVEYTLRRNGRDIPIFKTHRICGTVVGKNAAKASIYLLTPDSGVVNIKFGRDYFARYNRRISEVDENGVNKVKEQGWFQKGTLVVVNGFRRGEVFQAKRYKKTPSHQLYIIDSISKDGIINMRNNRYGEEVEYD